jgi:hypothetical protein
MDSAPADVGLGTPALRAGVPTSARHVEPCDVRTRWPATRLWQNGQKGLTGTAQERWQQVDIPEPEDEKEWTISVVLGQDGKAQDVPAWRVVPDEELEEEEGEDE